MSDFQKLEHKRSLEQKAKKCLTCSGIKAQPRQRIRDFYEAMLDRSISSVTILEVLKTWNVAASETTIRNHRRGNDGYANHMEDIKKAAGL